MFIVNGFIRAGITKAIDGIIEDSSNSEDDVSSDSEDDVSSDSEHDVSSDSNASESEHTSND